MRNNQNWSLTFKLDKNILTLIENIKKDKRLLIDYFPKISQGLIAYDKYQGQDEETIEKRAYHSFTKVAGYKPWLWGEDVTKYSVKWNEKEYINYCKEIANPREPLFFKGERILVREITNPNIYAGFANEEMYNDPSIIIISTAGSVEFSIKVLLGILNSKLATFFHFNSSSKATKGAFPKILVEDIKNFPIPELSSRNKNEIVKVEELANQILEAKKRGEDTEGMELQIDQIVYELYDLTPDEIDIVKGAN